MNKNQVCGECKLFTNETSFGDGWCEFHKKYSFCENVACEEGRKRIEHFAKYDNMTRSTTQSQLVLKPIE